MKKGLFVSVISILLIIVCINDALAQALPSYSPSPRPSASPTRIVTKTPTPISCTVPQSVSCSCECPGSTRPSPSPTPMTPPKTTSSATPYPSTFNQQQAPAIEFPVLVGGAPAVCYIDLDGRVSCSTEFGSLSTVIGNPENTTLICSCTPSRLKNVTVNAELSFSKQVLGAEGEFENVFSPGDLIIASCGFESISGESSSVKFDVSYRNDQALSFNVSGDSLIDRYFGEVLVGDNLNLNLLCEDGNIQGGGTCNFTNENCSLSGSAWFNDSNTAPFTGGFGCGASFSNKGKTCNGSFYLEAMQGAEGDHSYEGGIRVIITR